MQISVRSETTSPLVMAALKQGTSECHRSVERCLDLERASSSTAEYRRPLEAFYGFYQPMETRLREADWTDLRLHPIWRSERLRFDLESLDVQDIDNLPRQIA